MSVGNVNSNGDKGNNFPWQIRMLKGLQAMIDVNTSCCKDTMSMLRDISSIIEPQLRTPFIRNYTGPASVPAGAYSFSIANVGAAAGTVNGQSLPAGTTINFDAGALNNTLDEIVFDATGTTFLVTAVI